MNWILHMPWWVEGSLGFIAGWLLVDLGFFLWDRRSHCRKRPS